MILFCHMWCPDNCPLDNDPLDDFLPYKLPLGWLLPNNYPKDNCPMTISTCKMPPRKIAFRMICHLHNYPSDKWLRGKLRTRKIVSKINYTQYFFSSRTRNLNTLIDSCFPLFSFLWFKLVLGFDFCIRKKFINTERLKLVKKEQVKKKLSMK